MFGKKSLERTVWRSFGVLVIGIATASSVRAASTGIWYSEATHQVRLHSEGRRALAERIHLIRTAQASLRLRTFLFANDFSGNLLLSEIRQRKKQVPQLDVRLLLDYWGMGQGPVIPSAVLDQLIQEKIHVRYYNKAMKVRLISFNQRDHAKLMLADCDRLIVGGRNIEDGYFGLSNKMNFLDRDVWIQGPLGQGACQSFDQFWNDSLVSPHAYGMGPQGELRPAQSWEPPIRAHLEAEVSKLQFGEGTFATTSGISLIQDLPGASDSARVLSKYLAHFIQGAQASLDMETPTFIPKENVQAAIDVVANRKNFEFSVLTNTPRSMKITPAVNGVVTNVLTDWFRSFAGKPAIKIQLFGETESGQDPYVNSPEWSLHSKTYVRDQKDVMISSYNLSPRSQKYSSELGVVFWNQPELARFVIQDISWRGAQGTGLNSFLKRHPEEAAPVGISERLKARIQNLWKAQADKWTTDLL